VLLFEAGMPGWRAANLPVEGAGAPKAVLAEGPQLEAWLGEGAVVVDVRDPAEAKIAPIPTATNVPLAELPGKVKDFAGKKVILVCNTGNRSSIGWD
jgi:rhodanese-related sulfurtransferase